MQTALEAVDLSGLTLSWVDVALRMLLAMLIGAVIGTEREYTHRPAGMRTHMLVALGACAVMITSQMIFCQYRAYGAAPDPARLSAQVITGMGFLGAGTIIKAGHTIKGLTTAAGIWATACLGIAVGGGYYIVAVTGALGMLTTLVIFEWIQRRLMINHYALFHFYVNCAKVAVTLDAISRLAEEADAVITSVHVEEKRDGYKIDFKADFSGRHSNDRVRRFLAELSEDESTSSANFERSRF